MAVIPCPNCAKPVDSGINSCPYCHARIRGNPAVQFDRTVDVVQLLRILVFLVALLVLGIFAIALRLP